MDLRLGLRDGTMSNFVQFCSFVSIFNDHGVVDTFGHRHHVRVAALFVTKINAWEIDNGEWRWQ